MGLLITGILFLVAGVVLSFVLPMAKFSTTEFNAKKSLSTMFRCNIWGHMLIILGVNPLALYCLDLTDTAITWKNGIFLFVAILSISYVIERTIARIRLNKETKERKTITDN